VHTVGPWTIESDHDIDRGERYDYARTLVAANGRTLMCDAREHSVTPDTDEDWHLIAAAPDLLAVLEQFKRGEFGCYCMPDVRDLSADFVHSTRCQAATAAECKAIGLAKSAAPPRVTVSKLDT